jgi:quercetin dioxygenase-like cupin family protein
MIKKLSLIAVLAGIAFAVPVAAQQAPVSPSPVQRTPIGKTEVPGSNYEVITAMVTIQPGFKAGRHNHPGTVQAQVLEGEFMIQFDGEAEKIFKAGQSLEVPNQAIHNEGAVGSVPAKLIAVYVVEKGKPLVNPIK